MKEQNRLTGGWLARWLVGWLRQCDDSTNPSMRKVDKEEKRGEGGGMKKRMKIMLLLVATCVIASLLSECQPTGMPITCANILDLGTCVYYGEEGV